MNLSSFEYRIVEFSTEQGRRWMPQRGVCPNEASSEPTWCDAVPVAAPTRELADAWVRSLREFDAVLTQGTVVWES